VLDVRKLTESTAVLRFECRDLQFDLLQEKGLPAAQIHTEVYF